MSNRKSLTVEEAKALAKEMADAAAALAMHAEAIRHAQQNKGQPDAYTYSAVTLPALGVNVRFRIGNES